MRIAVICNDQMALPALHQLLGQRLLVAVASSDRLSEATQVIEQSAKSAAVPFQKFSKSNLESAMNAWLELHKPDVVLVKTFPWKIPQSLLATPKHGFINFHYAPLPGWRGSNPLFWMVRNGIRFGGVTVHRMDPGFDSGPILLKEQITVAPEATFGMVTAQLAYAGLSLTPALLNGLISGNLKEQVQDESLAKWYGRPKSKDLFVDWNTQSSKDIRALVNACNPWNKGAGVKFKGWTFGLTATSSSEIAVPEGTQPGTILFLNQNEGFIIACRDKKAIKAEVIYCQEGFFPGHSISLFGLKAGDRLDA